MCLDFQKAECELVLHDGMVKWRFTFQGSKATQPDYCYCDDLFIYASTDLKIEGVNTNEPKTDA